MSDLINRIGHLAAEDPAVRSVLQVLVGDRPTDPASFSKTARAVNEERLRVTLDEFIDGALRTSEVVERLPGITTRAGVLQKRDRKKLLSRKIGRDTYFPAWQFGAEGLRHDLPRLLNGLRAYIGDDAVAADRVMRLRREELGGHSLDDALRSRDDIDVAWRIIDSLGGPR